MPDDIAEAAKAIIAGHIDRPPEDLSPETRLDDLGVNSLQFTEIIMDLEDKFGIEFAENTTEAWTSMKSIADVIQSVETMIRAKA